MLINIHSYWAAIFILPKKVLKDITPICRNYLWAGKGISNKVSLVAWDLVYRPKREGGLGIRACIIWNESAIAKCV